MQIKNVKYCQSVVDDQGNQYLRLRSDTWYRIIEDGSIYPVRSARLERKLEGAYCCFRIRRQSVNV